MRSKIQFTFAALFFFLGIAYVCTKDFGEAIECVLIASLIFENYTKENTIKAQQETIKTLKDRGEN